MDPSRSAGLAAVVASRTPSAPLAEAKQGDARVLGFDRNQAGRRHRLDRLDLSHHVDEHVHVVRGLVGEDPAIHRPRAPPRGLVVVVLAPAPSHAHRAEDELAEPPGVERLAELLDREVVAVLLDDEEARARLLARFDHRVGVGKGQGHRFLDDDVGNAGAAGREDPFGMKPGGSADGEQLRGLRRDELGQAGISPAPVFFGVGPGFLRPDIGEPDELRFGRGGEDPGVPVSDSAAAQQGGPDFPGARHRSGVISQLAAGAGNLPYSGPV